MRKMCLVCTGQVGETFAELGLDGRILSKLAKTNAQGSHVDHGSSAADVSDKWQAEPGSAPPHDANSLTAR